MFLSLVAVSWKQVSNCSVDHYGGNQGPPEIKDFRELLGDLKMKCNLAPSNEF